MSNAKKAPAGVDAGEDASKKKASKAKAGENKAAEKKPAPKTPEKTAKPDRKPAAKAAADEQPAPSKTSVRASAVSARGKAKSAPEPEATPAPEPVPAPVKSVSRRLKPVPAPEPDRTPSAPGSESVRRVSVQLGPSRPLLAGAPGAMPVGRSALKPAPASRPEGERPVSERRLSKKELLDIRESLIARLDEILDSMRRELAGQRERAGAKAADDLDKASDASDENISFEIASAKDEELREIRAALDKLEKGTYGQCESCGTSISPSRLKVLPYATTCVSCRGEEERLRNHSENGGSIFSILNDEEHVETEPEA